MVAGKDRRRGGLYEVVPSAETRDLVAHGLAPIPLCARGETWKTLDAKEVS